MNDAAEPMGGAQAILPCETTTKDARYTNFDFIRVVAAASVIFSHSFPIAEGTEKNEPFIPWLGAILGIYGVYVFLIMSGFLVSRSLVHSTNLRSYIWKRALRVLPALAVGAVVSGIVIASFYSSLGNGAYILSPLGYRYAAKVILLLPVWEINTVSFYPGDFGEGVNGVLWTIQQEVFLYAILALLFLLRLFKLPVIVMLFCAGTVLFLGKATIGTMPFIENFAYALPSFAAGAVMYFIWNRFGFKRPIALLCGLSLCAAFMLGTFEQIFPLPAAYLTLYLGTARTLNLPDLSKFGDVSYGTYMYGWPVQQVVRANLGEGTSPWLLFAISLPIALCCGWLSWHIIEKRALRWKSIDPAAIFRVYRRGA